MIGAYSRACLLDISMSKVDTYLRGRLIKGALNQGIAILEFLSEGTLPGCHYRDCQS